MRGLLLILLWPGICLGERINHEGRLLGDVPAVTSPVLFNTPQADVVLAAMQIMPRDSAWNEDISRRPVLANSDAMIARITSDLDSTRRGLRLFQEMNFALVPDSQPTTPIEFLDYPDESDLDGGTDPFGRYPIPPNLPVETWPTGTGVLTLDQWQQDSEGDGGDRHSIVVKPGTGLIWETWQTKRSGTSWTASNGAKFNLNSNTLRPAGWTSGDAAGLPMFPALVRYDEVQRGMVEHAMRIVVRHSRRGPIYPATHQASSPATDDPNVPAMGQRLRLKASYAIPANWTLQEKAVLLGLKKYGALVADNGGFFSISITPDDRYPARCFDHLNGIAISNFEVIQSTAATGGPRSAGAPVVNAGEDRTAFPGTPVELAGTVTSGAPATVLWKLSTGPGTVTFGNSSQAATMATFSAAGTYVLMLSASDDIHTPAYDAVKIQVSPEPPPQPESFPVSVAASGSDQVVSFSSVSGRHYRVLRSVDLSEWQTLADNITGTGGTISVTHEGALDLPEKKQFYRVLSLD